MAAVWLADWLALYACHRCTSFTTSRGRFQPYCSVHTRARSRRALPRSGPFPAALRCSGMRREPASHGSGAQRLRRSAAVAPTGANQRPRSVSLGGEEASASEEGSGFRASEVASASRGGSATRCSKWRAARWRWRWRWRWRIGAAAREAGWRRAERFMLPMTNPTDPKLPHSHAGVHPHWRGRAGAGARAGHVPQLENGGDRDSAGQDCCGARQGEVTQGLCVVFGNAAGGLIYAARSERERSIKNQRCSAYVTHSATPP